MRIAKRVLMATAVAFAIGGMVGVAQAGSSISVINNIDWDSIGAGDPLIIDPLSLFPDFTTGYEDWIVSNTNPDAPLPPDATHPQGQFGIYEEKAGANLFDTAYGTGGFAITANGDFVTGSHCGVGEPVTYATFPDGENSTGGAVDRPALGWTWPAAGTTWIKLELRVDAATADDMTLEYYYNHGFAGYTHEWQSEHYDSLGGLKDLATLNVSSPRYAEIQVNVDFTDVVVGDYFLVSLKGGNPTFHAAGLKLAGPCFIAGDLDHDGDVDIFDWAIFQPNYGKTGMTYDDGDLDSDTDVDIFDWAIFQPNYGKTCGAGGEPIPEPASLALLSLGAAALLRRRR